VGLLARGQVNEVQRASSTNDFAGDYAALANPLRHPSVTKTRSSILRRPVLAVQCICYFPGLAVSVKSFE
jgi:hypothetical protein